MGPLFNYITRCRLTSGNRPILPQCCKEDVALADCVLATLNVDDNDEPILNSNNITGERFCINCMRVY